MTHLAVHVPCDNADTKHRAGDELAGFLNPNRLYAFMSSTLVDRDHAIAVQLTEFPAIPLEYVSYGKQLLERLDIYYYYSPTEKYTILED
jgi:hypothetical protein